MNVQKYCYHIYGISIETPFPIKQVLETEKMPQVIVEIGKIDKKPEEYPHHRKSFYSDKDDFLFDMKHVAKYRVQNGNLITIQPANGADMNEIPKYFMTSTMGALMHQRKIIPLHASVVETEQGCIAFSGPSGIGKSTIAAALLKKGYRIIGDDVCAIHIDDMNRPLVYPGYKFLKLNPESARALDMDLNDYEIYHPSIEKYLIPIEKDFCDQKHYLKTLYLLRRSDDGLFTQNEVVGVKKINVLLRSTYRRQYLKDMGILTQYHALFMRIIDKIRISKISRPGDRFLLDELVENIVNGLNDEKNNCMDT